MTLVLDASVVVKLLVDEPGTAEAVKLLDREEALIGPDWLRLEVASALWEKVKRSELFEVHAGRSLEALGEVIDEFVPASPLVSAAFTLSLRLRHPIYDCLYLAVGEARDATIVTADRKFVQAAERAGYADRMTLLE